MTVPGLRRRAVGRGHSPFIHEGREEGKVIKAFATYWFVVSLYVQYAAVLKCGS